VRTGTPDHIEIWSVHPQISRSPWPLIKHWSLNLDSTLLESSSSSIKQGYRAQTTPVVLDNQGLLVVLLEGAVRALHRARCSTIRKSSLRETPHPVSIMSTHRSSSTNDDGSVPPVFTTVTDDSQIEPSFHPCSPWLSAVWFGERGKICQTEIETRKTLHW